MGFVDFGGFVLRFCVAREAEGRFDGCHGDADGERGREEEKRTRQSGM